MRTSSGVTDVFGGRRCRLESQFCVVSTYMTAEYCSWCPMIVKWQVVRPKSLTSPVRTSVSSVLHSTVCSDNFSTHPSSGSRASSSGGLPHQPRRRCRHPAVGGEYPPKRQLTVVSPLGCAYDLTRSGQRNSHVPLLAFQSLR
jgi:hypothetical protein